MLELAFPIVGGLFATIALIVKYFDRRAKERAILAASTDKQREDIASIPPLSVMVFLLLASSVLCVFAAVTAQARAVRELAECQAKDCRNDDDCRPPAVCKKGSCVQTAVEIRPTLALLIMSRNRVTSWNPINGH